jgi:hypothetical protein
MAQPAPDACQKRDLAIQVGTYSMRSKAVDHDLDADQGILLIFRFHQLDHQIHDRPFVRLERLRVRQPVQEREERMTISLRWISHLLVGRAVTDGSLT